MFENKMSEEKRKYEKNIIPSDRPQRLRAKLTDADLEPLRDHPRFQCLMDRVNQKMNQQKTEF